jgi:hypothetical protein
MRGCRTLLLALSCLSAPGAALAQANITSASVNFGSYAGQKDTVNQLNCGLPFNTNLGLNHVGTYQGTGYRLQLGQDANYGGIGTGLTLINPANGASANIIQDVSGGGAAWQTSFFYYDVGGDRLIVFNQAAGNAVGTQWGWTNAISDLTETAWNPMWSDHYHPTYSKTGLTQVVPNSPCEHNGFQFDQGRGAINANPIETPYGVVTHIANNYQLRSLTNQYWGFEGVEQAFYLNGVTAAANSLQVWIGGRTGWREGPINPVGTFSVQHGSGSCTQSGCSWSIGADLDYIQLRYIVGGTPYDVIVRDPYPYGAIIANGTPTCTPTSNPATCGAIQIHTWMSPGGAIGIPNGQVRSYHVDYYVGTDQQVDSLVSGASAYSRTPAVNCNGTAWAGTNNQLPNLPVWDLVTQASFYSSQEFQDAANNNGTYASTASGTYGAGHLRLTPRTLGGTVYGFPDVYDLYAVTTNGQQSAFLGVYNTQPDSSGVVDVPLGYRLNTNAFTIVPVTLGTDNYGGHYLQLQGMNGCN